MKDKKIPTKDEIDWAKEYLKNNYPPESVEYIKKNFPIISNNISHEEFITGIKAVSLK